MVVTMIIGKISFWAPPTRCSSMNSWTNVFNFLPTKGPVLFSTDSISVTLRFPGLVVYFQLRWLFKCFWNVGFCSLSSERTTMMAETSLRGENRILPPVQPISSQISSIPTTWWRSVATPTVDST
ncbi:hypothetical protein TSUD_151010 [Trifolium subterraneum]|uniref:Uncharacterized protein n=1 Tax=Trifolium subterraneum TaxID=3900 RepID=A0A2Z6LZN8_TRISU|nr:hypothetical protein TSUD_151010 [Trifolium subterraneum]